MLLLLIIIVVVVIALFRHIHFTTPKDIGNKGEDIVRSILEQLSEEYFVFNDLLLEKDKD